MHTPTYFSEEWKGEQGTCTCCHMPLTLAAWAYHFALWKRLGRCPTAVEMAVAGMAQQGHTWGLTDRTITITPITD